MKLVFQPFILRCYVSSKECRFFQKLEKHVISSTSFVQKLHFFFLPFLRNSGPEGIFAIKNLSGFTCLRFGWPTEYLKPVNGGINRACRGTSGIDNQPHYYRVAKARLLEDCKAQCAAAEVCHGIEFSLGRCEIWQRLPKRTASLEGFSCFSYSPQDQGPLLLWSNSQLPLPARWHAGYRPRFKLVLHSKLQLYSLCYTDFLSDILWTGQKHRPQLANISQCDCVESYQKMYKQRGLLMMYSAFEDKTRKSLRGIMGDVYTIYISHYPPYIHSHKHATGAAVRREWWNWKMERYGHYPSLWSDDFNISAFFLCLNSLFCLQRSQPLPRPHLVPKGRQHIGDVLSAALSVRKQNVFVTFCYVCSCFALNAHCSWPSPWYLQRRPQVENGDMNWIIPDKFLAFAGPSPTSTDAEGSLAST